MKKLLKYVIFAAIIIFVYNYMGVKNMSENAVAYAFTIEQVELASIPIEIRSDLPGDTWAELRGDKVTDGVQSAYLPDTFRIVVRNDQKKNGFDIAHELGHYIGIFAAGDESEAFANAYARRVYYRQLGAFDRISIDVALFFQGRPVADDSYVESRLSNSETIEANRIITLNNLMSSDSKMVISSGTH